MKKEEAFKLTQDLLFEEVSKENEYIKQTVRLILEGINSKIQLGLFEISMQYNDFTNHVRLQQHKNHVFKCALDILIKEYNYGYVMDTNYKTDFYRLSWQK